MNKGKTATPSKASKPAPTVVQTTIDHILSIAHAFKYEAVDAAFDRMPSSSFVG